MVFNKVTGLAMAVALACVAGNVSQASAASLVPGAAILSVGGAGPTGGAILANSGPLPIVGTTFNGTLTSTVRMNDPSNPYGPGFLTFTYLIHNNLGSAHNMERMTVASFAGFLTDVSYQTPAPGGSILPTSMDRSGPGDVMGFSFTPAPLGLGPIVPNGTSALLVIQTNATGYSATLANLIDGSVATVSSFAPAPGAGVPEPATLSVAALGGAALLMRRRRRTV